MDRPTKEKKNPAVNRACERLSEELERLEQHQGLIENVLEAVTSQSAPEVATKSPAVQEQATCPLEGRIDALRERVQSLVGRLMSLMDRLEVG